MANRTITLDCEAHIGKARVYCTVDALAALKAIGQAYGIYDASYDRRDCRIVLDKAADPPALVRQEDISYHGSPCWKTVKTMTSDPDRIRLFQEFNRLCKDLARMA